MLNKSKLYISYSKKTNVFKIRLNGRMLLFSLKTLPINSKLFSTSTFNFLYLLRVLNRCGLVKSLKKF